MLVPPEGLVKLTDKAIPVVEQVKKMQTEVKLDVTRGQFFTVTNPFVAEIIATPDSSNKSTC